MKDDQERPEAPASDASDAFAALEQQAQALEGQAPGGPGVQSVDAEAQQLQLYASQLLMALQMLRIPAAKGLAWWEQFPEVWSDATLQSIAGSWAAICVQHDVDALAALGKYMPYAAAALSTIPPCWVTYQAIKERKEEQANAGKGGADGGHKQAAN